MNKIKKIIKSQTFRELAIYAIISAPLLIGAILATVGFITEKTVMLFLLPPVISAHITLMLYYIEKQRYQQERREMLERGEFIEWLATSKNNKTK